MSAAVVNGMNEAYKTSDDSSALRTIPVAEPVSERSRSDAVPGQSRHVVNTEQSRHVTVDESRHERRREATNRKIMNATLGIILSEGAGAVTIEEVARRSGVAKTSIYRRFKNTKDLLERLTVTVDPAFSVDDLVPSRENLHVMMERIVAGFDGELGLHAVGIVLSSGNEHLKQVAMQVIAPAYERFRAFIRRGQQTGVFRADIDDAFLFRTTLGSLLASQALGEENQACGSERSGDEARKDTDVTAHGAKALVESSEQVRRGTGVPHYEAKDLSEQHSEGAKLIAQRWASSMAQLLWPAICA